jgi:uncharacterized membrane protein YfcA
MIYLFLILTGLGVGFLSSFFGIGGGSLIIPVLYTLIPLASHSFVIATSLGAIFLTASLNSYRFSKQGLLPKSKDLVIIFLSTSLGSVIATLIIETIDKRQAKLIFSFVLVVMILKIIFSTENKKEQRVDNHYSLVKISITCFLGSIISGVTGLGGGIVFVPLLMSFVIVKARDISIYSNLAMMITTLTALLPYFFKKTTLLYPLMLGDVSPSFILLLFIGAFMTSKLGVRYNSKVGATKKKVMLTVLLSILAIKNIL